MTTEVVSSALTAQVVELALTVLLTLIAALAAATLPLIRTWVKANTTEAQFDVVERVASLAVTAAEQALASEAGEEKKLQAEIAVTEILAKHGIRLTPLELDTAIEAAVMNSFNLPAAVAPAVEPNTATIEMSPPVEGEGEPN